MQNILNLDSLVNKKAVSHNNKEGSRGHTCIAHKYIEPLITRPLFFRETNHHNKALLKP